MIHLSQTHFIKNLINILKIYGKNFNVSDSNWKDEMSPSGYVSLKNKE